MKMLYFLDSEKKIHRVIRRAIVVGLLSAVSIILIAILEVAPIYAVPITALLAGIDRTLRK